MKNLKRSPRLKSTCRASLHLAFSTERVRSSIFAWHCESICSEVDLVACYIIDFAFDLSRLELLSDLFRALAVYGLTLEEER